MPALGWLATVYGVILGVVIMLIGPVDATLEETGTRTISERLRELTRKHPAAKPVLTIALLVFMLAHVVILFIHLWGVILTVRTMSGILESDALLLVSPKFSGGK